MGKRAIADLAPGEQSLARKKNRKEKSEDVTSKTASAGVSEDRSIEPSADESLLSKAERKAAKKARREAKELKRSNALQETGNAGADADKAAEKAARKAEKKKRKAEEQSHDRDSESGLETKSGSGLDSARISHAPSSATSPEPVDGALYSESKELRALPQATIDTFLAENYVTVEDASPGATKLRPIIKFSYLPAMDEALRTPFAKFSAPTPIQAATWPFLLTGRDMIGVAETGSGKTLAFGVPCVHYISALPQKQRKGVKAVIVSPTRELAVQIHEQMQTLATPANLQVVCVYGGVPKDPQIAALRTAHIVVATPGRLNDLIGDGAADLSNAEYVVLDEADRMLDKGFEEAIRDILRCTPQKRQTLMFTATWPPSVRELAATFMRTPVRINIGENTTGELRANTRIQQIVEVIDPRQKETRLLQLLKQYQSGKNKDDRILVFCLYKKEAARVETFIRNKGMRVSGIHGDLSQEKRSAALEAFKSGHVPLLVATDVAARGLDIPAVKVVINVTFPLTAEDYVHRIGRTGRAGKDGLAVTLFTEHDKGKSGELINVLKAANQPVPEELMKFGTTVKKKGHDAYGAFYKDVDTTKKATKITFD